MVGWVILLSFLSCFLKLVCYAHVFPCMAVVDQTWMWVRATDRCSAQQESGAALFKNSMHVYMGRAINHRYLTS